MEYTNRRIEWIDSIRFLSSICVLFTHWPLNVSEGILLNIKDISGTFGVSLFFIVSGFLLPNTIFNYKKNNILTFFIRRIFRLFPLYVIIMVIYIIINDYDTITIILNLTMVHSFFGYKDVIPVSWTLGYEVIYIFITISIFTASIISPIAKNNALCPILLLFFLILTFMHFKNYAKIGIGGGFYICLYFIGYFMSRFDRTRNDTIIFILMIVSLSLSTFFFYQDGHVHIFGAPQKWGHFWFKLVAPCIFFFAVMVAKPSWISKFSRLGDLTYSMYLVHLLLIGLFWTRLEGIGLGGSARHVVMLALILVVSYALNNLIEKPFIRLSKKITS